MTHPYHPYERENLRQKQAKIAACYVYLPDADLMELSGYSIEEPGHYKFEDEELSCIYRITLLSQSCMALLVYDGVIVDGQKVYDNQGLNQLLAMNGFPALTDL